MSKNNSPESPAEGSDTDESRRRTVEERARQELEVVLHSLDIQLACDAYQDERESAVKVLILDNITPLFAAKEVENEHLRARIADLEVRLAEQLRARGS